MRNIVLHVARSLDVLHQINTVGFERAINAPQNVQWLRLIMHSVEGGDAVKPFRLSITIEIAQIDGEELKILQSTSRCFPISIINGLSRQVHSGEVTLWIQFGEAVEDAPAAATDIE